MTYRMHWKRTGVRFVRSEEGSAMVLVGLAAMMLLAAAGIAVDMGRVQVVQSRLSNSLDAAGLAAGSMANSGDLNAIVQKYFYANYPMGFMGSNISNPTVVANSNNSVLELDVQGTVPTTFMRIFGIENMPVSAHSQVTRASMGMELVLVLDTTGSMSGSAGGGVSKMTAAKNASNDLLDILYGEETTIEDLWVGLVPFAQAVNIGTSHDAWTSDPSMPAPGWGPTTWMGCVDARETDNRDVTDDTPILYPFPKYYWTCHSSYNGWYGNNSGHSDCDTWGGGFGYKTPLSTSRGPNKYCSQAITPLTANKNTVVSAINTLTPQGNTHIVLGAAWAWRLLSPNWKNLWGGEMDANDLPLDYGTPLMNKVVILMTDGDNTISNSTKGAYGYLSEGRLGTTNQSVAETTLNNRTLQVCTSMKNNGILIYTIAFGTDIGQTAQDMLEDCATSPDHYFYSPTAGDLDDAFHQIGDSLANLRVSQ